ncbi:hypothetical protein RRF57_001142 [Xylaria bambusicola]|uniref:GST C-terminal domain-containing protein n=1 Tax=Xylaria bambusicola TaxID=326684 RepID=A0AAN7UGW5_9PEZI
MRRSIGGYAEVTRYERGVAEGVAEKLKTQAGIHTRDILAWLEAQMGPGPFFNGATFGWADCAVAPFLNRSVAIGLGPAEGSPLQQWHARISELPCVPGDLCRVRGGREGAGRDDGQSVPER